MEISAIIRRYLEDRFELRAPELTTEEFLGVAGGCDALSQAQVTEGDDQATLLLVKTARACVSR